MVTTGSMVRLPTRGRAAPRASTPTPSGPNLTAEARDDSRNSVSIVFELAANTMVTLAVFDEDGRLVDVPFEGWLWPGRHEVDCCLKGRSPGKYKCLLDTPTVRLVKFIEVGFF